MSNIKPLEKLGVSPDWCYIGDIFVGVFTGCNCKPSQGADDFLTDEDVFTTDIPHEGHELIPAIGECEFDALYDGLTFAQWQANCRLAAQAPRLYAALYRLYQATPDTEGGELGKALQEARAAMIAVTE